jgi:competence protein ComEC
LHVGLAALCGVWLARLLLALVPLRCLAGLGYALTLVGGLLSASLYAALAGFGISTLRALLMLAVGMLALLSRRRVHAGRGILLALAVLLVCDPLAVFSPGFWLSFAAVAVLLSMFRGGSRGQAPGWRQLPQAQFGVMLALLPMSAWWFQSASLVGLAANLLAIPWISLVVVPLVLLGMMLMPLGSMASALVLSVAGSAAGMLASVLDWLAGLPTASLFLPQPSPATVLVATLGALMLLLLPRGIRHRWLGGVLLLPLFATPQAPAEGAIRMELLDVGQGTAVLVQSHRHLLLYDSGPGDGGEFNLVDPVIRPAVRASGHHAPERILISHTDLDHSGGLHALRDVYPATAIYASLRQRPAGIAPCNDQLHWAWDGFSFQVLHPSPYLPYIGNDSSCVLRVRGGGVTILLPGDISAAVESRLLRDYPGELTVLMAPHHGSRTGSSKAYLRGTKPAMAVAAAGLGNRFGFPHGEIRRRYREAGVPLWSTDACGALRLTLTPTGTTEAFSARRLRPAPWRWPADPSCP